MMKNVRVCVACGKEKSKKELLRMIRSPDGDLVVDWRSNLGGRGAHVCPTRSCIESAISKRAFERTLKSKLNYPKSEELIDGIRDSYLRQISTLISSAITRRVLSPGTDEATSAVKGSRANLLILAGDFSGRSDLENLSKKADVPYRLMESKELIGKLTNRPPTGVLAIRNLGLAEALIIAIDHYSALV